MVSNAAIRPAKRHDPADPRRQEWVEAARQVLLGDGPEAVSIARLARVLGISRGGFYWHFNGLDALMAALLEDVSQRCDPPALSALADAGFEAGLLGLLDVAHAPDAATRDAAAHARALSLWARRDPAAREALQRCSVRQIRAVRGFLSRHGFPATEARIRARHLVQLLLESRSGEAANDLPAYATDLGHLFQIAGGRPLPPAAFSRHVNRTLRQQRLREAKAAPACPQTAPPPP